MMAYSRDYLAGRRRARVRRRRKLTAVAGVLLLGAGGATTNLLTRPHHHVVVVSVTARVHNTRSKTATTPHEYRAAAGAPSDRSVKEALAATQPKASKTATAGADSGSSTSGSGGALTADADSSFRQLAVSLPSQVEVAVQPLGAGPREVLGGDEPAHGWSTTKVPVLVALLRARGGELTSREQSWAQSAITESNNESVLSLFGDLERLKGGLGGASAYMESVLRTAGDSQTVVATASPPAGAVTTFGQTEWSPGDAVKFFRALALGCLLPSSQTSYVLGLMESIEASESWGLGSAGFNSVAFKGGWGPEGGGYLVRQSGVIDPGSPSGVAVAIVTQASDFAAGTETLTRTASWLSHHLHLAARASGACSSE
jgi:hypothetical protein